MLYYSISEEEAGEGGPRRGFNLNSIVNINKKAAPCIGAASNNPKTQPFICVYVRVIY